MTQTPNMEQISTTPIVHNIEIEEKTTVSIVPVLIGGILIIIAGILTGYKLAKPNASSVSMPAGKSTDTQGRKVFGAPDTKSFRDSTEGVLKADGAEGEGTHTLIRPGGDSQTVYLTSSVLDMNQFVDKKVRVWGETFAAKKAGWFMDVGRIEILE